MSPSNRNPREYYTSSATSPWVLSLRAVGDHTAMRRAAAAFGLRVLALSPWKIAMRKDPATRDALRAALASDIVIATSPSAVRAAAALATLHARRRQTFCAIGTGTAAALQRAGIVDACVPERMDSEGLLALPELQRLRDCSIGLLSAPGGRDLIAPSLRKRGARLIRADVYARVPIALSTAALARLQNFDGPLLLPVSSGEALQRVLDAAPVDLAARLRQARVLAASARLAAIARDMGCRDVRIASGPRPAQMLAAAFAPPD
jgi:uroporphyrinogen-III synthase